MAVGGVEGSCRIRSSNFRICGKTGTDWPFGLLTDGQSDIPTTSDVYVLDNLHNRSMNGVDFKEHPRSLHDWPGSTAPWWCHCCNRLNDLRSRRCKTCGRSAAYGKIKPPANTAQRKNVCSQTSSLRTLVKRYT